MFLAKNKKSSFYRIVYFIDGKRTTHSTKKRNELEAKQYLAEFKKKLNSLEISLWNSFASAVAQRGVSLFVIKELLGHEDLAATQIHSHLQKQNLMDAVNLL